jgi:hypothetical protein
VGQGPSAIGKSFTFTILDDCILGGDYSGKRSGGSSVYEDLTITSQDCETYVLSNWNIDIFTTDAEMDLSLLITAIILTIPERKRKRLMTSLHNQRHCVVDPVTRKLF